MGLFPKEAEISMSAPERMAVTRERGTRRVVMFVVLVLVVWFIAGKVRDRMLLSELWPPLQPNEQGLTIVGTLDSRGSYERNMFLVVQANKMSRVALTGYGWQSLFTGTDGPLFSDTAGNAIKGAIDVNSMVGYAMLEPYLKVGVERLMNRTEPRSGITEDMPIIVRENRLGKIKETNSTLGKLIAYYSGEGGRGSGQEKSEAGVGSGTTQEVAEKLTIPGENLVRVCPVVLTEAQFTSASVVRHPPNLLTGETFTVSLNLTPEGRSRFYQWSRDHANENLVFILKGRVLTAGRVSATLDVNSWEIGPLRDGEAANDLADHINNKKS